MMRRFLKCSAAALVVLVQAGCLPFPVETDLAACPQEGLEGLTFTAGKPPGGTVISPAQGKDDVTVWTFTGAKDSVYLACHYAGGGERLQKLPGEMQSCARAKDGRLTCKAAL